MLPLGWLYLKGTLMDDLTLIGEYRFIYFGKPEQYAGSAVPTLFSSISGFSSSQPDFINTLWLRRFPMHGGLIEKSLPRTFPSLFQSPPVVVGVSERACIYMCVLAL